MPISTLPCLWRWVTKKRDREREKVKKASDAETTEAASGLKHQWRNKAHLKHTNLSQLMSECEEQNCFICTVPCSIKFSIPKTPVGNLNLTLQKKKKGFDAVTDSLCFSCWFSYGSFNLPSFTSIPPISSPQLPGDSSFTVSCSSFCAEQQSDKPVFNWRRSGTLSPWAELWRSKATGLKKKSWKRPFIDWWCLT